ncbi:ribonuclease H-like domain-containing protein [Tanacetum coccineum]
MSETEPIPPTSSVTALRIPIIKKGEYDLWSMKMRQYIAITDHILWDIITNGNQTTTDPASPSVSAPKTSLAANARRNNEKALNILLSAIPDRHLLSFHDAVDARSLWKAIKARFGGNEASKKMQKNLLKQQFETFTIGSREELDSAYERFQHILSMLELHDATVSIEDANLKFLRSLPSVWHVVATMIRGQPGLDELDFDDLYNNLKVYEHELKGVSNSNSQNIAFLSTEVKGSTLKQSTAEPTNIPKGYTQAASSKVPTAPNYASHSDEIICSFFSQQASMPTTHDDEDLLQIDEDAMEEIDIRWQVAMITARIRKFMRKTGRPIDLKPKNGITFDKSKIECFNCQKLGHFARECRFAKYQENRANGRQEKKIVAIEDSNSKALVATDNNEEIDWTKEFDAEPVTFAMMALTELEEDDWSMEIDAEPVHFGQDGLGDFDWSNKADDTPVSLALMATNSEVPYCSKCSKSYKQLLENYQTERDNFQKARSEILGYQMSLESLEVILKTHEKNEYAWGDKYEQMEYDLKLRDLKLEEKQKELDQVLKERDDFKVKLEKWTNASVLQNEVLNKQRYLSDKSCIGFGVESSSSKESDNSSGNTNSTESLYPNFQKAKGFHAVPPPTGTIIPPRANVSFTGIDELAIRNKVVNQENTKSSQPEIDRNKVIIEDWVDSDDEETALNFSEIQKKTVLNSENSETSFENRSPNSQNSVGQGSRKKGLGHKGGKTCFVCYSPDHLIKDCDLHERTFKQTQTHKPKGTQGSRDTRPVWNNINRVNHSNFSGNSRYPHQKRSFIPSAVLTREGLKSTARPKMTQTVPSKSTANVFYQGTARPKVPHAVLSQSTGRPYYPRMDNIRPRTSSFSPSTRSSTTRTPHRPQRPKKIMKSIWVKKESTVGSQTVLPKIVSVKGSAMINQTWRPKGAYLDSVNRDNGSYTLKQFEYGNPEEDLKDYAIIDSGCSGSMTGDKDKLSDFKEFKGGYVAFGNDSKGGRISGKGTIKTSCLDFEKVSYVEELKFNLLSVSQICDKKHNVLFTDKECLILSPKFKFVDEDLVMKIWPTMDEAVFMAQRLGIKGKQHRASCKKIEERTIREPLELLHMDLFGPVSVESVNRKKYCLVVTDDCSKFSWVFFLAYKDETYDMLHDLIVGLENKLRHKVKTIRCDHGTEFKNQLMNEFCAKKGIKREYSIARTPQQNGVAERKNRTLIEAARTMLADSLLPIQFWAEAVNTACYVLNRVLVTKPQMKTPYEILMGRSPNISFMRPFGCPLTILNTLDHLGKFDGKSEEGYLLGYSTNSKGFRVYNRVTRKVQDCLHVNFLENQENQKGKGPDWMFDLELLTPSMNYIPNKHSEEHTADKEVPLSSEEQALHDELVSLMHQESLAKLILMSKGMPLKRKRKNIALEREKRDTEEGGAADYNNMDPTIDVTSTPTLRIHKIHPQSQIIGKSTAGILTRRKLKESVGKYKSKGQRTAKQKTHTSGMETFTDDDHMRNLSDSDDDVPKDGVFSTNSFDDENTDNEEDGAPDYNNMDHTIDVSSTPTLRIHKNHPQSQIIGKSTAGVLTRRKLKESASDQHQALLSFMYKQNRTNHKDQQTCLFACFLSQEEPKKVSQALADESWVEAMQEELLQFKLQDVWVLCDLPDGKRVIGTKWVFRNKRDERGTIIKNKARLVAQGYRQEEGVDYDEVFAPVARIEAIRLFLAFASFMGFTVYQMDVKSAFLYGNITEEVYVKQPPGFEDPAHPNKVYRVVKALYGLHQAPRAWYERLSTFLLKHGYRRGAIDKTLFIKKDRRDIMLVQVYVDDIIFGSTKSSMVKDFEDLMQKEFKMSSMGELTFFLGLQVKQTTAGIFLSQDKYVKDILNKFDFRTIKPASTPIEAHKSLGKDEEGEEVDVHLYRSMIGCLMYLTASRPDIMFAVCLCARFQVTPKVSHIHAVKRIFRYLKHQPKFNLGLWYPKDSPFHLEAFSDSDYAGDNHDRRSTSGGCQYLGRRLVSWQCKKQTIVAISSTEAEYVAAASCCAQVLWMQNQLLDYGFNFMNTEIHIDNESTICIVRNPVFFFTQRTKHIQIRQSLHSNIADEQRLITR